MKKLALLFLILFNSAFLFASDEVEKEIYDQKFQDLSQKRVGLDPKKVDEMIDPFPAKALAIDEGDQEERTFILYAIFGERVKINERWYEKGDKINGYKIEKIGRNFAIITNGIEEKILKLNQGSKNVKITHN